MPLLSFVVSFKSLVNEIKNIFWGHSAINTCLLNVKLPLDFHKNLKSCYFLKGNFSICDVSTFLLEGYSSR